MNRRDFFGALGLGAGAAAFIAVTGAQPALASQYSRLSIEKDDPGEIPYAKLCGDGFSPKVFLDGVEQKHCITADIAEGWVKRHVTTDRGNLALNPSRQELLTEIARGRVDVELVEHGGYRRL